MQGNKKKRKIVSKFSNIIFAPKMYVTRLKEEELKGEKKIRLKGARIRL